VEKISYSDTHPSIFQPFQKNVGMMLWQICNHLQKNVMMIFIFSTFLGKKQKGQSNRKGFCKSRKNDHGSFEGNFSISQRGGRLSKSIVGRRQQQQFVGEWKK